MPKNALIAKRCWQQLGSVVNVYHRGPLSLKECPKSEYWELTGSLDICLLTHARNQILIRVSI